MNLKPIFNLFSLKGEAQAVAQQGVSTRIISSVALSLVALSASMQVILADEPGASGQPSIEVLRNMDPADRKFFNPGYGAQLVMPGEADPFPTIDPADRKFFNPGYGAQTPNAKRSSVDFIALEGAYL
jgi:hypothetical protein